MLRSESAKEGDDDSWPAWQAAAATDYWVLLHPELRPWRRGDPDTIPTIDDMRARAELIERSMDGIPSTWRLRPTDAARVEHLARVGWFHELMAGLYEPIFTAIRASSPEASPRLETLIRFLEADLYCHRSGYAKADAIKAITRGPLDDASSARLRVVVLDVVDAHDRTEFRAYTRLARRVDDDGLRTGLRSRVASGPSPVARRARWVLEALGEHPTNP
jgi:hypothetical protein